MIIKWDFHDMILKLEGRISIYKHIDIFSKRKGIAKDYE
jgi:hypothetical protein